MSTESAFTQGQLKEKAEEVPPCPSAALQDYLERLEERVRELEKRAVNIHYKE